LGYFPCSLKVLVLRVKVKQEKQRKNRFLEKKGL
jgi:hypothetical protein